MGRQPDRLMGTAGRRCRAVPAGRHAASIARRRERGKRTNRGDIDSERKERAGMGKRKQEPIIVKAYVKTADGGEVDVDTLSDEQREKLGTWLRVTYLNELCRGKAKFHVKQ